MSSLKDKVALVAGGSRGIGAAVARRLARDGAVVAITYAGSPDRAQQVVAAIQQAGGKAVAIQADSASPDAVRAGVGRVVLEFGALDILVNSAGVLRFAPIQDFKDEDFERMLAVNVRGAFYMAREAAQQMRDGGRIIFIGSVNGGFMPFAGGAAYALTKAAIAGFTRGLARDLAPRRITVNNVEPGPVNTEMNPADGPAAEGLRALTALKRYGTVEEIAPLVAFLAGAGADFITSSSIRADGGFAA